jgi:hypothetical protein
MREPVIAKANRRARQERKVHATMRGAMPPTGVHAETRKERDRRRALALRRVAR